MMDEEEASDARPLERARWEEHLGRWQQAEAQFATDPGEGLRVAERLLIELSGVSEGSPKRVVREMRWKREYPLGSGTPGVDANPLVALSDLGLGLRESVRMVQKAQAAARGINAARERRSATTEDFQQAMEVYRDAISQLLGVKRELLDTFATGGKTPTADTRSPGGQSVDADEILREWMIAEKLVRESMAPLEEAEARADRWRTARWATIQLVGSLVVGLLMLAAVIWVLSLS